MNGRPPPRADIDDLSPYLPRYPDVDVYLHANESPIAPPEDVLREILADAAGLRLNRYPDHAATALRETLADYAGRPPEWIWAGTGSNEILLDACLAYGGAGRRALLFTPTYSMHHRQARIAGTAIDVVPRDADDFAIDRANALAAIDRLHPDVVFVCSPNNPTGTLTPLDDVRAIAEASDGLVLLDEAYFEFCGVTFVPELDRHPNVIVVRTLSKAFRLAGARLGYAVAQPATLHPLLKVRMPYAQSTFSQLAARVAVERRAELLSAVPGVLAERDRLSSALAGLPGVRVYPSAANFVLFRHERGGEVADALVRRRILVRDFSSAPGLGGCLRVTVGTRTENDAFLEAVSSFLRNDLS